MKYLEFLIDAVSHRDRINFEVHLKYPDLISALHWKYGYKLPEIEMTYDEIDSLIKDYKKRR